jgi:hypothetical protein
VQPKENPMKSVYALMIAAACLGGCKKAPAGGTTGNAAAAKEMLTAMTKPGADHAALSLALRPKAEDYPAVFVGDAAAKMKAAMDPLWDGGKLTLKPSAEQTEIDIIGAPQANLATGTENAQGCPGGYKDVADKIQPKTTVYCFKFVKPGEKAGLAVDGLVWVNGHWALFPKPFRALK